MGLEQVYFEMAHRLLWRALGLSVVVVVGLCLAAGIGIYVTGRRDRA